MSTSAARSLRRALRRAGVITISAALLSALTVPAVARPFPDPPFSGAGHNRPFPERLELPDGFQPEGITIGGASAWLGSRVDGDVYRLNLVTGRGKIISEGPGTASVGLKIDHHGRLFIAGGPAGDGRVVDARTGTILKEYQFSTEASFINDVLITSDDVWFTNSAAPELYAVPLSRSGKPAAPDKVRTLELSGDWEQGEGFGANGLTTTPDRSALLVVHSTRGELHRVSPETGETTVVDLGDTELANGDGMLLRGRTLYVVQNQLNQVAVIRLNHDGTSGRLTGTLTSPDFDVPTTVAAFGPRLYLPNARFTTEPLPDTDYWVTAIDR
jgi:sugar lactone lactonase YvrE